MKKIRNMERTWIMLLMVFAMVIGMAVSVPASGGVSGTRSYAAKLTPQTIQASSITMRVDAKGATIRPVITSGNTQGKITYKSKDPSVATVDARGFVKPQKIGKTKITITVAGNDVYAKTNKTIDVTIKPVPTAIYQATSVKKNWLNFRWRSVQGIDGYQIRYSTSSSFSSYKTASIVAGKNSYTRKDLTPDTTYYVAVRTYKTANGVKLYSNWSGTKSGRVLYQDPVRLVPMRQLERYSYFRRYMTDAQFTQAYNVAVKIVEPLRGLSKQDQLLGIAVALRNIFNSGMSYSMSSPHYNDPYGYLVLGSASCAGCARTTGLCLNILGISYEHVNENQYSHQWARVRIGTSYWICDAYGMYCGVEPGPRLHPYLS